MSLEARDLAAASPETFAIAEMLRAIYPESNEHTGVRLEPADRVDPGAWSLSDRELGI